MSTPPDPGRPLDGERAPDNRRERGITAYARIFDVPEQDVAHSFATRVGTPFAEEALHAAGGAAWSHPALTGRDRSIAIITALAAQGVSGDRLLTHLALARRHGLDDQALATLMTLLAGYIGYPRASQAMETVHTTHAATPQDTTDQTVCALGSRTPAPVGTEISKESP
nr:carboxymuconolactone decarboxylase family protein [Streptomyces sp. NBC_00853]